MALLDKPNMKEVWASGGAAVKPSDEKIQTGWAAEVPPYQYENWIQGRQDQYLAHINQRGVPQWDGETEYEGGGLSYTQGIDGVVYKSVGSSGPSGTVQDPTTDVDGIYWEKAFADNDDPRVVSAVPNTRQVIAGDGLSGGGDLTANRTLSVNYGTTAGTAAQGNDPRLNDSREWTADTVSQSEAQAGTATTRRAWTAQRVRQAIDSVMSSRTEQTTGDSTVNLMSQKAITDFVNSALNIKGAYGLAWNQETDTYQVLGATDRTQIQSHMRRCVLNNDGTVNYYLDPNDSTKREDGTAADLSGADGNVMVEIPKFWYRHSLSGARHEWWVSDTPLEGFDIHPAFLKNGVEEVEFVYYRAYECTTVGGVLRSISGATPTRNKTRAVFRGEARANGSGWNLSNYYILSAIRLLYLTEYNTLDSQSVLGAGNHTGQDYGMTTGGSNVIGNASSGPLNNDTWMSYRGIENFYADCWEFIDGINVNNYQVFLSNVDNTYADGVYTGDYINIGVTVAAGASESYVKEISGEFLPTVVGGGASSTTYLTDGFWSQPGERLYLHGGSATDGLLCGVFCGAASGAFSHVRVDSGAGLSFR